MRTALRSIPRRAVLFAALAGLTGCATLRATMGGYETGPDGIARPQQRLREALAREDFRTAFGWQEDDDLLRALNTGVSRYYAKQFARSASVLDSAALIADDRITTSVSRAGLALLTNDLARAYQPRRTERLFIAYYGMLAYARLEHWEDAAVEARRLSELLAQYTADRADDERATHATLHYLAGVVFERAGERAESQVAYRNARVLVPSSPNTELRTADSEGEVLVVVERGFVAHRVTESINVFLGKSHRDSLRGDGDDGGPHRHRDHNADDDEEGGYWLAVAFPALRHSVYTRGGEPNLLVDGVVSQASRMASVLDDALAADERRERSLYIARGIARAAAKYVVTKAVKDKKGEVAGTIANIGASLLERADVRSWHLLPQELTLLRVRVLPGERSMQLRFGDAADGRVVDLGTVSVRPGATTIAAVRLWNDQPPNIIAAR
jgi:hypothetical protein